MAVNPSKCYPRALPFQAGDPRALPSLAGEKRSPPTRPGRPWLLRLSAGVLLVVLVAAVIFFWNQGRADTPPPSPETAAPQAAIQPPQTNDAKPAALPTTTLAAVKDRYLEALGGLSASHLYQSYLNIGLLADGVEKEVYALDEAEKMLGSVTDLMNLVEGQLAKVRQTGLEPDDHASLERIKAVTALLRLQTETLQAYWVSGDMEEARQYHQAREATWKGLSKVLGLEG